LLDDQKYFLPNDLPAPAGDELRPLSRPRLRTMVKHVVQSIEAEELGARIRRRQAEGALERLQD